LPLCRQHLAMAPLTQASQATAGDRMAWSCPRCRGLMKVRRRLTAAELAARHHRNPCCYFDTS
jgi:hypothetical protein